MNISPGQTVTISVEATELFGGSPILTVTKGDVYSFSASKHQIWEDSWVKTNVEGFFNPLLWISGRRVRGVKCFALCGTIGKDESHHFRIGSSLEHFDVPATGKLYFFPNDSISHYHNNKGTIEVVVTRIK